MADEMVTLRNGSEVPMSAVMATMLHLRQLLQKYPIVAVELVLKCRDYDYDIGSHSLEDLKKLGLLQADGNPHEIVQNIVLSIADGEGKDMRFFDSPLARSD